MSRVRSVVIPMAAFLVLGTAVVHATSSERMTGDIGEGHIVYQRLCELCHGTNGHGDGSLGKAFVPPPANLSVLAIQSKSDTELLHTILKGKVGTGMPAFREQLSDKHARDVLAFVRSLAPRH